MPAAGVMASSGGTRAALSTADAVDPAGPRAPSLPKPEIRAKPKCHGAATGKRRMIDSKHY